MRLSVDHPMHPFAEFFDLISMRTFGKRLSNRTKVIYVEPSSDSLQQRKPIKTSSNHHSSDEDDWGQRAITKQLASGNQIPGPKRKN